MSGHIDAVTDAIHEQIATFRPTGRDHLDNFTTGLPGMVRDLGNALTSAADNMTDDHVHPQVLAMFRELGAVIRGTADAADATVESHKREHQMWLND
jgi:hypothetical protein